MNRISILKVRHGMVRLLVGAFALAIGWQAHAQPFIVSTLPANGASGVSTSAPVVFTFSEQMDTALTEVQFFDAMTFTPLPTTSAWSANNTVLTCTPTPAFPLGRVIVWTADGESLIGDALEGNTSGFFTTGSGGGGGGSGTNRLTAFSVAKLHFYSQTSAGGSTLDPDIPYLFTAATTLSSNRTASGVTVTIPAGGTSNLTQNFLHPETFSLFATETNLASFNAAFPSGNYLFNVTASTSNQQVNVNLPAALTQPGAPHIANFAAAQSVNPSQAFQLSWDAFPGGTATDYISVSIGDVFDTPDFGTPGALNGTATSVTIPAGTLQPNSGYSSSVTFYRSAGTSNASYTTIASLATITEFQLTSSSGGGSVTGALIFTNAAWSGGTFSFNVISSTGQIFTVEYSSTMLTNQWLPLLTTNSITGLVQITHPATNKYFFYRARKGP